MLWFLKIIKTFFVDLCNFLSPAVAPSAVNFFQRWKLSDNDLLGHSDDALQDLPVLCGEARAPHSDVWVV